MDDFIDFIENEPVLIDHPGIELSEAPLLEVVSNVVPAASAVFENIDWPRRSYVAKEQLPAFREKIEVSAQNSGFRVIDLFLSDFFAWQSVLPSDAVKGRLGRVAYSWNGVNFPEENACRFLAGSFPGWRKVCAETSRGFLELTRTLAIIEIELESPEGKLSLAVLQRDVAMEFRIPDVRSLEFPDSPVPQVKEVSGGPGTLNALCDELRSGGKGLAVGVLLGRTRVPETEVRKAVSGAMLPIGKMEYSPAALVETHYQRVIAEGAVLNIGGAFAFRIDKLQSELPPLHGVSSLPLGFVFAGKTILPPEQVSDWENGTLIELGNSEIVLEFPQWAEFGGDFITNGEKAWFVFGEKGRP